MLWQEDQALPQLATALDSTAMQKVWQEVWAYLAGTHVTACQIERVKYRPGASCIVSYLVVVAQPGVTPYAQRLCAYLYPPGQSLVHWDKAQPGVLPSSDPGLTLFHLPALEMVVRVFPNDRKLTALAALTDAQTLQAELLPPLIAAQWGAGWQINRVRAEVAQYFPEHNCMVRVETDISQPETANCQGVTFYAKTYYNQAGAETHRLMQALWESTERRAGYLAMAQPLAYDAQRRILWQRGVSGETLLAYEPQPALFTRYLAQAARMVASLHQIGITPLRAATRIDWVSKLQAIGPLLAQIWPDGQARSAALLDHLLRYATAHAAEPVALLHGDLHLQNFLIAGNQPVIIDLDDLALGSPWQEVGSFLAGLHYRGLRNETPLEQVEAQIATFCQHYAAGVPWLLPAATLRWYTASALLIERVARLTSRLTKGDVTTVIQLFERAEALSQGL